MLLSPGKTKEEHSPPAAENHSRPVPRDERKSGGVDLLLTPGTAKEEHSHATAENHSPSVPARNENSGVREEKAVPDASSSSPAKNIAVGDGEVESSPVTGEINGQNNGISARPDIPEVQEEIGRATEDVLEDSFSKEEKPGFVNTSQAEKMQTGGPLSGIRILDLSRLYPGPLATMMMAEMGAEVIKIEDRITPDGMRAYPPYIGEESAGYLAVNRSKRSIAIKFNEERGQEVFFQLVKTADIVIEQFRPGALDRIGMGYFEAIKANPRIIYISLTGYGQTGPYAHKPGHDINYMGYAGIIAATGAEKSGLVLPGVQIADVAGGAYMAIIATLSALWARERSGTGQRVDVSMLDSILPLMSLQMAHYWSTGKEQPPWQLPLSGGLAFYGIYKCADGRYLALGAIEPKFWKKFCELVEEPHWIDRMYAMGEDAEKLKIQLARLFQTRTRKAWIELLEKAEVCISPVRGMSEVEHDPHLQSRQMIVEYDHPQHGKIKGIGSPLKFSRHQMPSPTPPPALGEHTLDILQELGYSERDVRELLRKGAVYINKKK